MNKERILLAAVGAMLLMLLMRLCETGPVTPKGYDVKIDTVTKYITHEPIYIQSKAKVRYTSDTIYYADTTVVRDTVYSTRAFVAELDTIVKKDTVSIAYMYPRHTFSIALRRGPDSVKYEVKTITITNFEQRPLWVDVLSHGAAAAVGYGVGRLP